MKSKKPKNMDIVKKRYGGYVISKFRDGSFNIKRSGSGKYVAIGQSGGFRDAKKWIDMKV